MRSSLADAPLRSQEREEKDAIENGWILTGPLTHEFETAIERDSLHKNR